MSEDNINTDSATTDSATATDNTLGWIKIKDVFLNLFSGGFVFGKTTFADLEAENLKVKESNFSKKTNFDKRLNIKGYEQPYFVVDNNNVLCLTYDGENLFAVSAAKTGNSDYYKVSVSDSKTTPQNILAKDTGTSTTKITLSVTAEEV